MITLGKVILGLMMSAGASQGWQSLLGRIVNINSGTTNTSGSEAVRGILIPEFERLGFSATTFDVGMGHRIVSLEIPNSRPSIALVGHIDTVFDNASPFSSMSMVGDKIFGPGVIDMKGGIVLMLEVLSSLKDTDVLSRIKIVLNDDEEIGSTFSRNKLKELLQGIQYGLIFEPGLPDGALVTAHSGVRWLELTVRGKAAHAGLEHPLGINACVELGHKLTRIAALTDYSRRLTLNPGVISGGTAPNVVCETASTKIDVRFKLQNDLDHVMLQLNSIRDSMMVHNPQLGQSPTAESRILAGLPSMDETSTQELFEIARRAGSTVGQEVKGTAVGYASDANHLAESGLKLLVGLGPYGGGMHTTGEYLLIESFAKRLALNRAILVSIAKGEKHGR